MYSKIPRHPIALTYLAEVRYHLLFSPNGIALDYLLLQILE